MHHQCPKCDKPWLENEIEFQVCDVCGYENPKASQITLVRTLKLILLFPLAVSAGILFAFFISYLGINLNTKSFVTQVALITWAILWGYKKYFMKKK
jgi:hypothetical protein